MSETLTDLTRQAMAAAPTAVVVSLTVMTAIVHGLLVRVGLRTIAQRSSRKVVVFGPRLAYSRDRKWRNLG